MKLALNALKLMPSKPLIAFTTTRFQCRDFVAADCQTSIDLELVSGKEQFEKILQSQDVRPRLNFQFAIIDSAAQKIIGTAGVLLEGMQGGDAKLIMNLSNANRGRYAAAFETGYGLINWAFDALSLTQLTVVLSNSQETAKKLVQYAGFSSTDQEWRLSYGSWAEHAEKLWKNHGNPNH
jgi:hypothetical protein